MLLQRFRATADFIEDLQYRFGSNVKIQEHLTRKYTVLCKFFGAKTFRVVS